MTRSMCGHFAFLHSFDSFFRYFPLFLSTYPSSDDSFSPELSSHYFFTTPTSTATLLLNTNALYKPLHLAVVHFQTNNRKMVSCRQFGEWVKAIQRPEDYQASRAHR